MILGRTLRGWWRKTWPWAEREPLPRWVRAVVWRRDRGQCRQCGSVWRLQFDHFWPWIEGGEDDPDNLQLLCRRCNGSKGARKPGIFTRLAWLWYRHREAGTLPDLALRLAVVAWLAIIITCIGLILYLP